MERLSRAGLSRAGLLTLGGVLAAITVVILAAVFGSAGPSSAANPPGNNGTIKVDGVPFDDHPDNEPHVGCVFQIDFYGYDEGDLFADVTFEVHPPTGKPAVILTDEVFIGEDDNSGGGSEAGLDASATYDLSTLLQGFEPHPQQGWHVKLTINAEGSQGADVKYKVFWVSGCETPPTTSTTTTSTTTPPSTTTSTSTTTSSTTSTSTTMPSSTTSSVLTTSTSTP
jgi:hypothetical protein